MKSRQNLQNRTRQKWNPKAKMCLNKDRLDLYILFLFWYINQKSAQEIPNTIFGLKNIGNTCFFNSVMQVSLIIVRYAIKLSSWKRFKKKTHTPFSHWMQPMSSVKNTFKSMPMKIRSPKSKKNSRSRQKILGHQWVQNLQKESIRSKSMKRNKSRYIQLFLFNII